jgi:hypothetical protein
MSKVDPVESHGLRVPDDVSQKQESALDWHYSDIRKPSGQPPADIVAPLL